MGERIWGNLNFIVRPANLSIVCVCTVILFSLTCAPVLSSDEFQTFWTKFKSAVAKNDCESIANMTKFPYLLGGNQLNRKQFIKQCPQMFDAKARKSLLKEKPIKDKDCYEVFVGESIFIFSKVNGNYMFTEVGAND